MSTCSVGPHRIASDLCPCGQPLHYQNAATTAYMRRHVARFGTRVVVVTLDGAWLVPWHYYALHDLAARLREVKTLAAHFGWERVRNSSLPTVVWRSVFRKKGRDRHDEAPSRCHH